MLVIQNFRNNVQKSYFSQELQPTISSYNNLLVEHAQQIQIQANVDLLISISPKLLFVVVVDLLLSSCKYKQMFWTQYFNLITLSILPF